MAYCAEKPEKFKILTGFELFSHLFGQFKQFIYKYIQTLPSSSPFTGTHESSTADLLTTWQPLSPGQTIKQSWIQHATLLDVKVEVVAKHYPTLLHESHSSLSWRG